MRLLRGRSTPASRAIPYPCRCLCRGFVQSTRTTPARRMTLQFLQIRLTDARTFMTVPSRRAPGDAPAREVERRQLDRHLVARGDPHVAEAHRPRDVRHHLVPVVEADAEERVRHRLGNRATDSDGVTLHVP